MSRYFYVRITGGTSDSLYSVYYNSVITGNLAYVYPTTNVATGLTLSDLTSTYGVAVQVPDFATNILLYNDKCGINQIIDVGGKLEEIVCICITVIPIKGQGDIIQVLYCPNGFYSYDKPVYEYSGTSSQYSGTSITWNENNQYWEILTFPPLDGPIRTFDPRDEPITGWQVYGECSEDYIVRADICSCPDPTTIYYINCEPTNPTCLENQDGSIISNAIGGTGGWTYSLDGINYQPIGLFTELYAGSYTVYAMDSGGTVTTCSVLLEAQPGNAYPLAINVTQSDSFLSSSAGMKFYQLNFSIDPSGLPSGVTAFFNFSITYNYSYAEPGVATFNTVNHEILINNIAKSILPTPNSQSPVNIGFSDCGNTNILAGFDEYESELISVTNNDFITGAIVYGINTDTAGVYEDPCSTNATMTITASLKNKFVSTYCDSLASGDLIYSRQQIFSGTGITQETNDGQVTTTTTTNGGGGGGMTTTTTTGGITTTTTTTPSPSFKSWGNNVLCELPFVLTPACGVSIPTGLGQQCQCVNGIPNLTLYTEDTVNDLLNPGVLVYSTTPLIPSNLATGIVVLINGTIYAAQNGQLTLVCTLGQCL